MSKHTCGQAVCNKRRLQTCILAGKRGKHCCESFNRFPITKRLSLLKVQFRDAKSFLPASMQACSLRSSHTASPAMIARHVQRAQRFHMKSRLLFKFPTAFAWRSNSPPPWKTLIIKFPPPRDNKGVKFPGYARGGMLKLRFDRSISPSKNKPLKKGV